MRPAAWLAGHAAHVRACYEGRARVGGVRTWPRWVGGGGQQLCPTRQVLRSPAFVVEAHGGRDSCVDSIQPTGSFYKSILSSAVGRGKPSCTAPRVGTRRIGLGTPQVHLECPASLLVPAHPTRDEVPQRYMASEATTVAHLVSTIHAVAVCRSCR
jgi:hypothetical protein